MRLYVKIQTSNLLACEANSEGKDYNGHVIGEEVIRIDNIDGRIAKDLAITILNDLGVWHNIHIDGAEQLKYCIRATAINTKMALDKVIIYDG